MRPDLAGTNALAPEMANQNVRLFRPTGCKRARLTNPANESLNR